MTFTLTYNGDIYEITLRGHVIGRITCYPAPYQQRQDVQFDDLPTEIQDLVLNQVQKQLSEGEE